MTGHRKKLEILQTFLRPCHASMMHTPLLKKKKFSIKHFFCKCDQIHRHLRIWSHLQKKSLMENFIFWAVAYVKSNRLFTSLTYCVTLNFREKQEIQGNCRTASKNSEDTNHWFLFEIKSENQVISHCLFKIDIFSKKNFYCSSTNFSCARANNVNVSISKSTNKSSNNSSFVHFYQANTWVKNPFYLQCIFQLFP